MKATSRCVLILIGLFFCVITYSSIAASFSSGSTENMIIQVQPSSQDPDPVPAAASKALAGSEIVGIPASVVSIYDGDTFRANLKIAGCPDVLCDNLPVRIQGIDAPEIKGKCDLEKMAAQQAKDYLTGMISGKTVDLRDVARDKFFRVDAVVYVDGADVGQMMLNRGHARVYHANSKRAGWCDSGKMT